MKKFAILLATIGLSLTLVGAGLAASFTASGTATTQSWVAGGGLALTLSGPDANCSYSANTVACNLSNITVSHGDLDFLFYVANNTAVDAASVAISPAMAGAYVTLTSINTWGFPLAAGAWAPVSGTLHYEGLSDGNLNSWLPLATFTVTALD